MGWEIATGQFSSLVDWSNLLRLTITNPSDNPRFN